MTGVTLSGDQFILFVLLLKMGIMAALAGALITSGFFKRLIFLDTRNTRENWQLALVFGLILAAGTAVRVLVGYEGMDLSLSGTFLVGLLGGMVPGSAVGFFVGLPGLLRGEWATLPFLVVCGLSGGIIRARTRDRDEFWSVSPFFSNNIARSWRVFAAERRIDARAAIMLTLAALEAARTLAGNRAPAALFIFHPGSFLGDALRLAHDARVRRHPAQDMEQHARRGAPRGAALGRRAGALRRAQEPDQSALPLQRAERGDLSDLERARKGPVDPREALEHPPAAAPRRRGLRAL